MSGRASRKKGHDFERKMARTLTELTGRKWKRGIQARAGGAEGADVYTEGLPYHFECKKGKRPPLKGALEQAERDCSEGDVPIAIAAIDRQEPIVLMRLDAFLEMFQDHLCWVQHRSQ